MAKARSTRAGRTHGVSATGVNGKRFAVTVHGTLQAARKELRRLLREGDTGEHVDRAA